MSLWRRRGFFGFPVYEYLSARGFKCVLVDGRAAKALPGRKTDVKDCEWIRDLHAHGLLNPCLVPEAEILVLRTYWRQRARLIEQCSEQVQLMQKSLEQMNVQLHRVLSDISGISGMSMVRAILAERARSRSSCVSCASKGESGQEEDRCLARRQLDGTSPVHAGSGGSVLRFPPVPASGLRCQN